MDAAPQRSGYFLDLIVAHVVDVLAFVLSDNFPQHAVGRIEGECIYDCILDSLNVGGRTIKEAVPELGISVDGAFSRFLLCNGNSVLDR